MESGLSFCGLAVQQLVQVCALDEDRGFHTVHIECADKLFKRLRGARLDSSYEDKMRKLHRIDLLIIVDLALRRLEATETNDSTS